MTEADLFAHIVRFEANLILVETTYRWLTIPGTHLTQR